MLKIKHELIIGIVSIILLVLGIGYIVVQYNTSSSKPTSAATPATSQSLTLADVQKHNTPDDCWIVIENKVYAVSSYLSEHPGGREKIIAYCGKDDASQAFATKGKNKPHSQEAQDLLQTFYVGGL